MLQAFVDASGKGDSEVLVIAGYVAQAEEWAKFSDAWKAKLDELHLDRFKMTEMAASKMEFAGYLYKTIEEHNIIAAVSFAVDTAGLGRFVDRFIGPSASASIDYKALKNPYLYAARAIIESVAMMQSRIGLNESIDFIFDDEAEKGRLVANWDWFRSSLKPELRNLVCVLPKFEDDEKVMPLQAADLWAWWVRKWYMEGGNHGIATMDLPWSVKRIIPRLHSNYDEDFLRSMLQETLEKVGLTSPQKKLEGIRMAFPDPSSSWWRGGQ